MKSASSHIRVAQGLTTKVYKFYKGDCCTKVHTTTQEIQPIIFRNAMNYHGRLRSKMDIINNI